MAQFWTEFPRRGDRKALSYIPTEGDMYVRRHDNGISMVGLDVAHPVLAVPGRRVTAVNFDVGRTNRLDNLVSGKRKRGGLVCQTTTILCEVECSDGFVAPVRAAANGRLLEVNQRLLKEPGLLSDEPQAEGWIAILYDPLAASDDIGGDPNRLEDEPAPPPAKAPKSAAQEAPERRPDWCVVA